MIILTVHHVQLDVLLARTQTTVKLVIKDMYYKVNHPKVHQFVKLVNNHVQHALIFPKHAAHV